MNALKTGYNYDEVLKVMNERESYNAAKHNAKELEQALYLTKDELYREQKVNKEKIAKLEMDLQVTRGKLDDTTREKEDLHCKVTTLENRIIQLQQEVSKKERENFNSAIAENTERHLTSLCQTLNSQIEDLKDQLRLADERSSKLNNESLNRQDKIDVLRAQCEQLKQEIEAHVETQSSIKKSYDEQLKNRALKEKDLVDKHTKDIRIKDEQIEKLKIEIKEFESYKLSKQQLSETLTEQFQGTAHKYEQEIQALSEALKLKQVQCNNLQNEFEYGIRPKIEEHLKNEREKWEQEQNYLIRRELSKLNEEKNKEIARVQEDLLSERDKSLKERERIISLEKELDEVKQELKVANKEKSNALMKAREALKIEAEKLKEEMLQEKHDEANRYKRIIKELESEVEQIKIEQYQYIERDKELLLMVERNEKTLIKELNDEQRRVASLVPGLVPKIVNYSNLRNIYTLKNFENVLSFSTFQQAFSNLKTLLDEVATHVQTNKIENEQLKKNAQTLAQEKDEAIENVKRQYERQKQKDLESLREYMTKDQNCLLSNTNEINSLVQSLKNKDREIHDIQTNMNQWKQETLEKLAEKFESELNKELDRRMQNYKCDSSEQQLQLDKIRKEMDSLVKEYRDASQNLVNREAHERMINYYKSRLDDFRNENISLRQRLKSSNYLQTQMNMLNASKSQQYQSNQVIDEMPPLDLANESFLLESNLQNFDAQDEQQLCGGVLYSPSVNDEEQLIAKNEILKQRLNDLEKLQSQLNGH